MKKILKGFKCIIDNEYLNKYIDLIFDNKDTEKTKFKTQMHHFIPVAYYKDTYNIVNRKDAQKIADEDNNNFKVNLLYKDHVLAHYYLALCSESKFKYQNENAIFHVLGNINYIKDSKYLEECCFIKSLDKYQELYEDMARTRSINYTGRHCKPNTEKHKQQISAKNSGNIYVRKKVSKDNYIVKKARTIAEFNDYITKGWEKGSYPMSFKKNHKSEGSLKKYQSNMRVGAIYINNGKINKIVYKKDFHKLDKFYSEGWKKGRVANTEKMVQAYAERKIKIKLNDSSKAVYIRKDQVDDFIKNNPQFKIGGLTKEQRLKAKARKNENR